MTIQNLTVPFPDFKLQDIINPDQFDSNFNAIQSKINEMIPVISSGSSGEIIPNPIQNTDGTPLISISSASYDILSAIISNGLGVHTFYAIAGCVNNPSPNASIRGIAHLTDANNAIVYAIDWNGLFYSNAYKAGAWQGWKHGGLSTMTDSGTISLTPSSAGVTVNGSITFTQPFTSTPQIVVTANTSYPEQCNVSYGSPSASGCTIYLNRTVAQLTVISWIAIGS